MHRIVIITAFVGFFASCTPKVTPLAGFGEYEVEKYSASTVEATQDGITVTSTREYGTGGVNIKGKWDLTGYNAIRFTVTNHDELEHLILVTELCNAENKTIPWGGYSFAGKTHDRRHVRPGEAVTLTIDFPPVLEHPEINDQFTTMLNTPYSANHFYYNVDLSDIKTIRFFKDGISLVLNGQFQM